MGVRAAELVVLQPGPQRRHALHGRTTIGVRDDCDLQLFDAAVEPIHAVVLPNDDSWLLRSAAYSPCTVNDKPVVESVLADRDVIRLGNVTLGFRILSNDVEAKAAVPVAATLTALRDDVFAERSSLAEERAHWEAELERRRQALTSREQAFRDRAARTARAVQRERERVLRQQRRNEQRASDLDKLAQKLAEQQKSLDLEKLALRVDERRADEEHRKVEQRRALVTAEADATISRLAAQKKELLRLDLEVERRRKDLERYAAPGALLKDRTLIEREYAAAAMERDAAETAKEIEQIFRETDALLARLERKAGAAESLPTLTPLRIAIVADDAHPPALLPMIDPAPGRRSQIDLVAWADDLKERSSVAVWWDAREAEFRQAVREWRDENQRLMATLHEKQHAVNAAKSALAERELRLARDIARDRAALHREREAIDRRRTWLDRAQQRYANLQTAAHEARLTPMELEAVSALEMIAKMKATEELWQQFRCDVLRERMELACERERWKVRDHELVTLRRLVLKQRTLLAAIVSDQNVRDRLWNSERQLRAAAALERESAIEGLAFALLDELRPTPIQMARQQRPNQRKAA